MIAIKTFKYLLLLIVHSESQWLNIVKALEIIHKLFLNRIIQK